VVARPLIIALFFVAGGANARAQDTPASPAGVAPLTLAIDAAVCAESADERAALSHALAVELSTDGVGLAPTATSSAAASVQLDPSPCTADAPEIAITLSDTVTHKALTRAVSMRDVAPPDRARVLAVAIAELLRASWAEMLLTPRATTPTAGAAPERAAAADVAARHARSRRLESPRPAPPAPPRVDNLGFGASLGLRAFSAERSVFLGGALGGSRPFGPNHAFRFAADMGFYNAVSSDRLGSVRTDLVLLGASVAISIALGEHTRVELGPRLEAGIGIASGEPAQPGTTASVGSSAVATVVAEATLRQWIIAYLHTVLRLSVGGSFASITAEADDRPVLSTRGITVGMSLGFELAI